MSCLFVGGFTQKISWSCDAAEYNSFFLIDGYKVVRLAVFY